MATARMSRWYSSTALPIVDTNGSILPAAIVNTKMTTEQLEAYIAHFRIREITQHLQYSDDFLQANHQQGRKRAPSPDPEYDAHGRRTNTRAKRHRRALEAERHAQLEKLTTYIPEYQPPQDYHRNTRLMERVPIPQADYPHIKLIGQLLGPRGTSLKAMEFNSSANIAIRGIGAAKEGQRGRDTPDDHLALHALITADAQGKLEAAKKMVQQVIHDAIHKRDGENMVKQQQMRDLAKVNGTLRDDEGRRAVVMTRGIEASVAADTMIHRDSSERNLVDSSFDEDYGRLMEDLGLELADRKQIAFKTVPPWRRSSESRSCTNK